MPWCETRWGCPEWKALPQSFLGVSRESHAAPEPQAGQLPAASPRGADPALPRAATALLLGPPVLGAGGRGSWFCAAGASAGCESVSAECWGRLCVLSVACLSVVSQGRLCVIVGCLCFEARGE